MLAELAQEKIIAVLRKVPFDELEALAEALYAGGIRFMEVTFGRDDALNGMSMLVKRFSGRAYIGAGTVLNAQMARDALSAGAQFLLAPGINQANEIISLAHENGAYAIPGAMTPTEIQQAVEWGADAVKVFPAATLGADYLKHVHGPLGDVKLIPTGGINLENAGDFFREGAFALGIGGNLLKGALTTVHDTAKKYVQLAKAPID